MSEWVIYRWRSYFSNLMTKTSVTPAIAGHHKNLGGLFGSEMFYFIVAAMTREVDVFRWPQDKSWTNSDRQDDLVAEIIKFGEDGKHFTSIWLFLI